MSDVLTRPKPFERLQLTRVLNGSDGSNRNLGSGLLISAENDLEALGSWLSEFERSPDTYRSYRKEIERLLLWCLIQKRKPFSSLTKDDLNEFERFLESPSPIELWCGNRVSRASPDWKPFVKGLSASSIRQSITIIGGAFSYLSNAGYLIGNPVKLIRRKNANLNKQSKVERFLERQDWRYVMEYILLLPEETPKQCQTKSRITFLFSLLYLLGLRVSEVSALKMNSFKLLRGKWWCYVPGKGAKLAKVPANTSLLSALSSYRLFLGLTPLPSEDDSTPLIRTLSGTSGISGNMVYRIVKGVFCDTSNMVVEFAPNSSHRLTQASTHWVRHTSITHQADLGLDLRLIMKTARHNDIKTTQRYLHAEDEHWHASHERLKV